MGNYRESGEVLFMKNGMKKTAAVVMAAMLMGTGAVIPAAEDMGIARVRATQLRSCLMQREKILK